MNKSKLPFGLFVTAEAFSLFGQAAYMLVLPWLLLTTTGSAAHTSAISTIITLPSIVASLASGFVIDHIGRRRASVIATLGCATAAAGLAIGSTIGITNVVWLIGFGLLASIFLIPSMTARDTLMKDVASASGLQLERVAGMRQLVFGITFLAGPGLAGVLLTHETPGFVLWIIAALWGIAAICTRFLPTSSKTTDKPDNKTVDGSILRRMLRSPVIVYSMVIALLSSLISSPVTDVLIPAHFRALNEPQLFGLAMSILAVGTLVGSVLYMVLTKVNATRLTYFTSILLMTVSFGILALLPSFWILASGLFLMGVGSSMVTPFFMVAITANTKDSERGRVMSLYNTLSLGSTPLGLALLTLLLSYGTLQTGFISAFGIWIIVAVVMLIGSKKLYTIKHDPTTANN